MILIENLSFGYSKKKTLLNSLNFSLNPGHIYGLLGKNGSGKSTLLRLISGLLFPKVGTLKVDATNPALRLPAMLQEIFFLPEEFIFPALSASQYAKYNGVFYKKFSHRDFLNHLHEFEIDSDLKLNSMSMGQKKKVAICFGLATNANYLMLDEPTNGLDIPSKSIFRKILAHTVTDERIVLVSTHQVNDLESLIDEVIILDDTTVKLKSDLHSISQKISFEVTHSLNEDSKILYSESTGLGYRTMKVAESKNSETDIDLEILFKGVIKNSEAINRALN